VQTGLSDVNGLNPNFCSGRNASLDGPDPMRSNNKNSPDSIAIVANHFYRKVDALTMFGKGAEELKADE
jgi:hypothetical protein